MIIPTKGNLLKSEAEMLVNPVNCVGVMGKGLALEFKKAFPKNFEEYEKACSLEEVKLGEMFIHISTQHAKLRFIANFPTKDHWRDKSRLQDIDKGLRSLVYNVRGLRVKSIAIPALGCGLGGLDWVDVKPLIEEAFFGVPDVDVFLYEPK